MKNIIPHLITSSLIVAAGPCSGAISVTTAKSAIGSPFAVSAVDLGQAAGNVYSATGSGSELTSATAGELFNGLVGNNDGDTSDSGEVTINSGNTLTVTLNTSVNTLGYDITGINSVFGWDVASNGRSNQGYSIVLTFMDNSTATLVGPTAWEPNSPAGYWSQVAFSNGGGVLFSNTVSLNGGPANAGTGISATGVKAITFSNFSAANAGGVVLAREFDVFGVATVPEPSVSLFSVIGLGVLLRRRRP